MSKTRHAFKPRVFAMMHHSNAMRSFLEKCLKNECAGFDSKKKRLVNFFCKNLRKYTPETRLGFLGVQTAAAAITESWPGSDRKRFFRSIKTQSKWAWKMRHRHQDDSFMIPSWDLETTLKSPTITSEMREECKKTRSGYPLQMEEKGSNFWRNRRPERKRKFTTDI